MNLRVDCHLSGVMLVVVSNLGRMLDWRLGVQGTVANVCAHWHEDGIECPPSVEMDCECLSQSNLLG